MEEPALPVPLLRFEVSPALAGLTRQVSLELVLLLYLLEVDSMLSCVVMQDLISHLQQFLRSSLRFTDQKSRSREIISRCVRPTPAAPQAANANASRLRLLISVYGKSGHLWPDRFRL